MNKKYKLFIFDFDGTLGDTKECIIASFQKSLSHNHLPFADRNEIIQLMGVSLPNVFKKLVHKELDDAMYEKLIADYRTFYREFLVTKTKIFPEVMKTLKILKEKNILCTIATSKKTEFAILSCKYLGIDQYIDFYIGDDMVTQKKPDPEMLIITLKKLHINKQEAFMIGDSTLDIDMGNAIDVNTIAVTWGSHAPELLKSANPTYTINKFSELLKFA